MSMVGDILGGFGIGGQDFASDVFGGAVGGASSGAMGGGWGAAIGAIGGAVGGYFDYAAAKEQAEAAKDIYRMQIAATAPQQQYPTPYVPRPTGVQPAAGQVQPTFNVAPTMAPQPAQPTGYAPSRSFFTTGDQMQIQDPWVQAALGALAGGVQGYVGQPVVQPSHVEVGPQGYPLPGQSQIGAVSPAAMNGGGGLASVGALFRPTPGPSYRAIPEVTQVNPVTGNLHYWRHMGRAILLEGDLRSCGKVERVARRASKAVNRTSSTRRRPPAKSRTRYVSRSSSRGKNCKLGRDSKGRFVKRR